MNQIMGDYSNGQVAWAYRHFPLDQLHPVKARAEAIASECVNEIGGNPAFWEFADRFFELTPSNNQTDIETVIPQIVQEIGIDTQKFNTCINSGKYDQHIEEDIANAVETGGRGTPWSVVIAPNGKTLPLNGAQPYSSVKQLIEIALNEK
ncbi:MAG: thioredoxin domain-containing protein, partial [Phycisphaerae bacterium]|nr:thioredoxin domain-containing protein [Phycisphaerae bacterium]NIR49059.1 thioredoxin domain-containing protein [candidate division KSB1 bacterium]NIS24565.1 thioredoxin domain-containing protein [candidate division KSB1 bacterium]NIU25174.1 thioredoxin domain-containing protein [candidate division KSB1 bacterium]NIV00815.1 thioredoxin domain-containing protein [Phycisphaerae bacterium]